MTQPPMVTFVVDNDDGTLTCTTWKTGTEDHAAVLAMLTALFGPPMGGGFLDTAAVDGNVQAATIAVRLEP